MVRWHYRDAGLVWLFVPAYALHVAEEWFGGFPDWVAPVVGSPLPPAAFLGVNAVAMTLLVVGIAAAIRSERSGWVAVAAATVAIANTIAHLGGAMLTGSYSPGLVSAVVLYVPLGSLTLLRAIDHAPRAQLARGMVVGLVLHAAVFVMAFAFTRGG